jgi:hypothetical protein
MAIRRPSISSPDWLFQDFLYQEASGLGGSELRYVQIKWDGEPYTRISQSFDYSDPPYVGSEQRGGSIVGQIDYEVNASTRLVTIYSWAVNWRDEWPLRLGVNYLGQCLYPASKGFQVRVAGNEVYTSAGEALEKPNQFPYAFWVSEQYDPLTNRPDDYLLRFGRALTTQENPVPIVYGFDSFVQVTVPDTYILVTVTSAGVNLQTPLYWKVTGDITPALLVSGFTEGVLLVNSSQEFLKLSLVRPVPTGPTGAIEFYADAQYTTLLGTTTVTL